MSLLVYFPKDQFSPRYGDKFFTVSVTGYSIRGVDQDDVGDGKCSPLTNPACFFVPNQHVEFHVTVRQGHAQWTVNHRYRSFLEMAETLRKECISQHYPIYLPNLPHKTWFTVLHDENFLNSRRLLLDKYLETVLSDLSRKGLVLPFSLATFLQINPIAT